MLLKYISIYLQNRPAFFSLIRPQEAVLFNKYDNIIEPPILDLGCGDGFFAETVFGRGKIDVGLDIRNERTEKIKNAGIYKKIVFFNGVKIPFPDNYFSTVVSNCVLEHVGNLENLLKEIGRVLAPGGYFLTTVMTEKWEEYLFGRKIFGKKYAFWMRKKQEHKNLLSPEDWRKVILKSGFKIEKETGYLSKTTSMWMDFFHYMALPQLASYKLFGRWVIFPEIFKLIHAETLIKKLISYPEKIEGSAAIFYVLCRRRCIQRFY